MYDNHPLYLGMCGKSPGIVILLAVLSAQLNLSIIPSALCGKTYQLFSPLYHNVSNETQSGSLGTKLQPFRNPLPNI